MVHDFKTLALFFEVLAIVIMPFGDLHIQDIVFEVLDVLEMLGKHSLQFIQVLCIFRSLGATKHWHALLLALSGKLKLTFADLQQVFTSLNESFVLSKDGLI